MRQRARYGRKLILVGVLAVASGGVALVAMWSLPLPLTMQDFHVFGTQVGDVSSSAITTSDNCMGCHGPLGENTDPYATWSTSKMAHAGRNPLFFAQMALANQDVDNAGYYCMRCHAPMSIVSGTALDPSGESLNSADMDGVNCYFCHSMVDPDYKPGISPPQDESILAALDDVPAHFGNSMFVLDPTGTRRGVRDGTYVFHDVLHSPFHQTGSMCGTCHDVGNVAISLPARWYLPL